MELPLINFYRFVVNIMRCILPFFFFQGLGKFKDFGFPVVGPVSFNYIQIRVHRVTCVLVRFLFGEALVT